MILTPPLPRITVRAHPTTQVQAKNTRLWPESTSLPSAPRNRVSASRFGGALATSVLRATRSPTSGPSRPPKDRTHTEWSGSASRTHTASSGRDVSHSRGPSLTSSATSQNENARKPGTGSAESSPTGNCKYHRAESRNRTPSWQAPANASPPVFTTALSGDATGNPLGSRLSRDQKAPGPDPGTRSHQNRGAAR